MRAAQHQARRRHRRLQAARRRGVAAVLAMMFLVIFASLAAAMAIVSQGNLATADAHLKVNRALAAAESGMQFVRYHLDQAAHNIRVREGVITPQLAQQLWVQVAQAMVSTLSGNNHNLEEPYFDGTTLHLGPIAVGPSEPAFTAILQPHPLPGQDGNYGSPFYQRPPYSQMSPPVSNANPLDGRWIRVKVVASDEQGGGSVFRSISMDFRIDKKIPYAILSKSRIMIGRNVLIEGPIGSTFLETHLTNGHPIQMMSDFYGLDSQLDSDLDTLRQWLVANDANGDNRLNVSSSSETQNLSNPQNYDKNNDGYIDEYDYFLAHFDSNADGKISKLELDYDSNINARQLFDLINTFGDPDREGYGDGFIDESDRYAKVRGQVYITADMESWIDGAANGAYQDYFQGPLHPDYAQAPLTFQASQNDVYQFGPEDFDVSSLRSMADGGDLLTQASSQDGSTNADGETMKMDLSGSHVEEVPYGAAHPYDFYNRPVFENMTFTNVVIPKGTNALFRNCRFIGVTFVETETDNDDPNFNFAGRGESDGSPKHPDRVAIVDGEEVADTKTVSNNLRFDNCTFEGAIVSDAPEEFTHVRNKIAFTGKTQFLIEDSTHLTPQEKAL
ncbi:MAG TPA: hypothetical protein VF184_01330, partial [Phycisphaeraceae bacterium]